MGDAIRLGAKNRWLGLDVQKDKVGQREGNPTVRYLLASGAYKFIYLGSNHLYSTLIFLSFIINTRYAPSHQQLFANSH